MKSNKKILIVFLILGITGIIVFFIFISNLSLFDKKETLMAKININNNLVNISFIETGATTSDIIQVYLEENGNNRILKNIEKNNFLLGYEYINDSTFKLIVNQVGVFKNKPDTIEIFLK